MEMIAGGKLRNDMLEGECPSCGKVVMLHKKPHSRWSDFCEECREEIERIEHKKCRKTITDTTVYGADDYYCWMNGDDGLYF